MPIYLGPTEHIDRPENLLGSGDAMRTKLKSYLDRQKEQQHPGQDPFGSHSRFDEELRKGTQPKRTRF